MKTAVPLSCLCAVLLGAACTGEPSTPGTPAGPSLTVSGKVLDDSGQPIANASVLVLGPGRQPVKTDGTGAFRIPEVPAPYDIAATGSAGADRVAVYQGLSRDNPTLIVSTSPGTSTSATVKGIISGGTTPYTSTRLPRVSFVSPRINAPGGLEKLDGTYGAKVTWPGPASLTGSLFAFEVEAASPFAVPTNYLAYGRRDSVVLAPGATLAAQDIAMEPVAAAPLQGAITLPSGYARPTLTVSLVMPSALIVPLFGEPAPASSFSYKVPVIPQSSFTLSVTASSSDASSFSTTLIQRGVLAGTPTQLVLQASPRPQQPADRATDVTRSTEFSWEGYPDGLHGLSLSFVTGGAGSPVTHALTLYTNATRTVLPDLSALGWVYPASTPMSWSVSGYRPFSVDGLAGVQENQPVDAAFAGAAETIIGSSGSRQLTTSATP